AAHFFGKLAVCRDDNVVDRRFLVAGFERINYRTSLNGEPADIRFHIRVSLNPCNRHGEIRVNYTARMPFGLQNGISVVNGTIARYAVHGNLGFLTPTRYAQPNLEFRFLRYHWMDIHHAFPGIFRSDL